MAPGAVDCRIVRWTNGWFPAAHQSRTATGLAEVWAGHQFPRNSPLRRAPVGRDAEEILRLVAAKSDVELDELRRHYLRLD